MSKTPDKFSIELEIFSIEFNNFSKKFFAKKTQLVKKYPKLIAIFYKELEDFGTGGKAMRPFLVYLGYKAAGGKNFAKILPVCLAVELVHNFLLIHDDIIDKSDTRRGKPAVHKKLGKKDIHYGISQGIVIADIAAFEAIKLLNEASFSDRVKSEALNLLTQVVLETAYGEVLDVEYSQRRVDINKVWLVAELKTAKYSFVGPLKLGALLAGANKAQLTALENYGLNLGKAFQIQDDILGVFGNEKVLGKSTLSDMREGKNTLLFYKSKESASPLQRRFLERVWGSPKAGVKDLESVKEIMRKTGAFKWCNKQMQNLTLAAKESINRISKDKDIQEIFAKCADFVIFREK